MCKLLLPNKKLYCALRRRWVTATAEESIRQQLLQTMLATLGYPSGLLAVEVALKSLVPRQATALPNRRIDIACYTPASSSGLKPLLLIECKAVPLTEATLRQVAGYNYYLAAPYLAIANATAVYTGYRDTATACYNFVPRLPSYRELLLTLATSLTENS